MPKKLIILTLLFLTLFTSLTAAQEKNLDITVDTTYLSRFIDKGFDCYRNNHSGIQPSVDVDLYNTGLGIKVHWFRANSGGFENDEKLDYRMYCYNSFFKGQAYAIDYKISWIYHNFTDSPNSNGRRFFLGELSRDILFPLNGRQGVIMKITMKVDGYIFLVLGMI